jgi:hypothetical protein
MALFTTTNYPINALIENIDHGKIGLPDLQRPFVWPNVNVRNLFDSLYRGYPAGFLLFWDTGAEGTVLKGIGSKNDKAAPETAIVDGQQRLTSLYAVVKGTEVIRANFKKERIRIAFSPLTERFEVTDAAILKDKSFIPDISELWKPETDLFSIANGYIEGLSAVRELTPEQIKHAQSAIGRLHNLLSYQFVVLTLSSTVDAETIAEVFVRINGEGKKLNQADFIMTLMSVFWDEGRADLEKFARDATKPVEGQASSFNHFIRPAPDQMLRATVGLGLKRARLENVYAVLRGRDAVTGKDDPVKRQEQFAMLANAQARSLNLANWHHFLSALTLAGYRSEKMISSQTAIIYSYVLYLIGISDFGIDKGTMRQAVAEFFFMAALTGRYTNSPETRFEADLAQIRGISSGEEYLAKLREVASTVLTPDYWEITLPSALATSASRSPSLFAYQAALIKLDALALYSPIKLSSLVDPAINGSKAALEQHHLFPRAYLNSLDITDTSKVNQIANFAPVEWPDNIKIGAKPPSEYVPPLDANLSAADREQLYFWHALPPLWWELDYDTFLKERRTRIARVIQRAWEELTKNEPEAPIAKAPSVADLVAGGETDGVEFKSTLRTNLHTGQSDEKIQLSALKTIAGFLNNNGGTLLIGVADDGEVLGLDADNFPNEDKYGLHLVNLISDRIGSVFLPYVHPHFTDKDGKRVLAVLCERGPRAAFVKDGQQQRFYVRGGNATTELQGSAIMDFVKQRFG